MESSSNSIISEQQSLGGFLNKMTGKVSVASKLTLKSNNGNRTIMENGNT